MRKQSYFLMENYATRDCDARTRYLTWYGVNCFVYQDHDIIPSLHRKPDFVWSSRACDERWLLKVRCISLRRLLVSKNVCRCLSLSFSACLSRNAVSYKQSHRKLSACVCPIYFVFFHHNHSTAPLTTDTRCSL